MTVADFRFRKREHVRSREDFARVFAARRSASDGLMVVYVVENKLPWSRLGMSVSRRVGGAVVRNYIRRRLREAFRTNKAHLPTGVDIICIARRKLADRSTDIAPSLKRLVRAALRRRAGRPSRQRRTAD